MSEFRRRLMMQMMQSNKLPTDGVYIQSIDGKFYTSDEWILPNEQANGVAVIDSRHPEGGFIVNKGTRYIKKWSNSNILIENILTSTKESTVIKDYIGKSNTEQIIAQDSTAEAAIFCNNFTFPNGQKGYLGAAGEWQIAVEYKQDILRCIGLLGGACFEDGFILTSTQRDDSHIWLNDSRVSYNNEFVYNPKSYNCLVYPFTTLQ